MLDKTAKWMHDLLMKWLLVLVGFGLLPSLASAETLYVTDKLMLGIYSNPDASGEQLKVVTSGTQLEVLERQGRYYAKVRTEDGIEGWVKSSFLVSDVPALIRIQAFESQMNESDSLQKTIQELKRQNSQLSGELAAMSKELVSKSEQIENNNKNQQVDDKSENQNPVAEDLSASADADSDSATSEFSSAQLTGFLSDLTNMTSHQTLAIAGSLGLLLLLLGGFLGRKSMEWSIRRKYHGYRIW